MGRALIIICSGLITAFGFMGLGSAQMGKQMTMSNAGYANITHARNAAQTGIQLAMNEINKDPDWYQAFNSVNSPWHATVEGADIQLFVENISTGSPSLLKVDTLRITSDARYFGEEAKVVSVYERTALHYVPKFKAAMQFATNQFNFSISGSASINGADESGTCSDKPGILVQDNSSLTEVDGFTSNVSGDPATQIDSDLSYSPVDELIARLENMNGVTHISGNYKGEMGSADDPGVFFIDEPAKLTGGIDEGYGIMVVRNNGELEYEGSLDVAGNFKFNGLVIFENAWNLDGKGTPRISGSVLVGNTMNTTDLNVDLNGTIDINLNCQGETYAQQAAAGLIKQNMYKRITTFE
ncbi:MAG: hypothetical protein R3281_18265 [Balneolaceae bacterium]|nr:hypothetical protein [Balneolaceae bacterium]